MRKALLFSLIFIAGIVGCNKPKTVAEEVTKASSTRNPAQPEWVDNGDRAGKLTAVGIAQDNPLHDLGFQRTVAVNHAMANLAVKLQANVDALYAETTASQATSGKKINTQMAQETRNVMRSLVTVKLKNMRVTNYWTDHQTGNLFVLASLGDDAGFEVIKDLKSQKLLEDSLTKLDTEIAKGRN
jgi:ribosomal protein RSM22 (predicted rRNA methylase)